MYRRSRVVSPIDWRVIAAITDEADAPTPREMKIDNTFIRTSLLVLLTNSAITMTTAIAHKTITPFISIIICWWKRQDSNLGNKPEVPPKSAGRAGVYRPCRLAGPDTVPLYLLSYVSKFPEDLGKSLIGLQSRFNSFTLVPFAPGCEYRITCYFTVKST